MAKEKNKYRFAGIHIDDVISKPLISIARAESMMAKEQIKLIMDSCFDFNDGVYSPILLKMTVSKNTIESDSSSPNYGQIVNHTNIFHLPIVTIFPINSLGIDNVNLNFNMEIMTQYEMEKEQQPDVSFLDNKSLGSQLMGRISNINKRLGENKNINCEDDKTESSINVNIEAKKLPLTKGLLEIIDVYTNYISINDNFNKDLKYMK